MEKEIDYKVLFLFILSFKFKEYVEELGDTRPNYERYLRLTLSQLQNKPDRADV